MPRPTPGGVPVVMTSPGSSVMYWLTCDTICAQLKIMVRVLPDCMRLPFTSSHISSFCGSLISSVVTSHGPIGPWLVTTDEITDPQKLDMWLDLNGKRMQSGNTRTMIFSVAQIVSHVSQYMTLLPGDIIATGTPPGVGLGIKPNPVFLKPGDVMTLGIRGLGEQKQKVVGTPG